MKTIIKCIPFFGMAVAGALSASAEATSCIVSAGSETYTQAAGYSTPVAVQLCTRVSASAVTTASVETRRKVSSESAGSNFSTKPVGSVFVIR